jgi:hypothetical protein
MLRIWEAYKGSKWSGILSIRSETLRLGGVGMQNLNVRPSVLQVLSLQSALYLICFF